MNEEDFVKKHINPQGITLPDWECRYCGDKNEAASVLDHIVPKSRGGTDEKSNLQQICRRCNYAKNDSTAEEFERWIDDLVDFRGRNK